MKCESSCALRTSLMNKSFLAKQKTSLSLSWTLFPCCLAKVRLITQWTKTQSNVLAIIQRFGINVVNIYQEIHTHTTIILYYTGLMQHCGREVWVSYSLTADCLPYLAYFLHSRSKGWLTLLLSATIHSHLWTWAGCSNTGEHRPRSNTVPLGSGASLKHQQPPNIKRPK